MTRRTDRFGLWFSLGIGAVVIVAYVVGFVWLPGAQAGAPNLWTALCIAAGFVPQGVPAPPSAAATIPSEVIWTSQTEQLIRSGDAARGSALAATCAGCHGAKGISPSDQFPNLAAQPAEVVFKQLSDFHAGKRVSPIMQGFAAPLSEQQMADLASYFAGLPAAPSPTSPAPRLVTVGDPARGIAPCAACHGPMGHKIGAPDLAGQKSAYLQAQLEAFANATRRNDINEQMRAIAHDLHPEEIAVLAQWYGGPAAIPAKTAAASPAQ